MTVENNYKVMMTNQGQERMEEIIESTFSWMGPENTVGDFITTFLEELVEEWLGEDVCSLTITEVENDKEARKILLKRICESPMMEVFKKVKKPEDL